MFYSVYILYSLRDKKLYVGCTSDLLNRVNRHKNGNVQATKYRLPLELIHSEQFEDKIQAFNRERFLKSLWGAREKKKILRKYFERIKP
jgi:putative endonuclease